MNLSNENKLLLNCAHTKIPDAALNQVKTLIGLPLNWEVVLKSAFWYGIAPLLYHNLKGIQEGNFIPQEVMDQLKKANRKNMARNMYLYAELRRIVEVFREKDVEVMVLKGAALAEMVYGNIALRSFSDLDLLVRKEDLPYADKIMLGLGYSSYAGGKSQEWYRNNHYHLNPYFHPDRSTVVEVHWHITEQLLQIGIDDWWKRARVTKIASCRVLVPSPEDMLIHSCLHLYNHGYDKSLLRGISDISETLRYYKDEVNWEQFENEVDEYEINKLVYSILYLVKKIRSNDGDLPNWLEPAEVPIDLKLVALMQKRVFTEDGSSFTVPGPLVQWLAADKFRNKVRILLARIFPTREVMSVRYSLPQSSKKVYFYYLVRPHKLFLKYGRFILDIRRLKKEELHQ